MSRFGPPAKPNVVGTDLGRSPRRSRSQLSTSANAGTAASAVCPRSRYASFIPNVPKRVPTPRKRTASAASPPAAPGTAALSDLITNGNDLFARTSHTEQPVLHTVHNLVRTHIQDTERLAQLSAGAAAVVPCTFAAALHEIQAELFEVEMQLASMPARAELARASAHERDTAEAWLRRAEGEQAEEEDRARALEHALARTEAYLPNTMAS
ncbi:hypothetical protein MSAN_01101900 [Mycena sanguinolenta]|uniref:Uncharacterized protein n=1 Tax=Mycena sanguinolenta TaxID=230812 RepID=A0A8H6YTA1_9AGAR|nr:hypothetical protein MSAN_01101900 [Mycena sanguinolenta]